MRNKLHSEILTNKQKRLLLLVKKFRNKFGLVGGTAIALHIGHRESIDFDLFSFDEFKNKNIKRQITEKNIISKVIRDEEDHFTLMIGGVLFTFFHYPFKIDYEIDYEKILKIPPLLTLAAMKFFALGRRAKWKNYVDLYFIIKDFHSISEIVKRAKRFLEMNLMKKFAVNNWYILKI